MNQKDIWEEIFSPLKFKRGTVYFHYTKIIDKKEITLTVAYTETGKWKVVKRSWNSVRPFITKMEITKKEQRNLIERVIRQLEKEWKRMEKGEIEYA